jgi:hypothetical protein
MANISELYRSADEPQVTTSGAVTSASENWIMKIDAVVTTIEANVLLKALTPTNSFGFTVTGSIHPADNSLLILGFTLVQAEVAKTYTEFLVTTTSSNNKDQADANVSPAQAQASYSFDSVDYEVIVSETQGVSRVDPSNTLGITLKDEAIQNTNGVGIVVTEPEKIQEVTIVRNEDSFSLKEAAKHLNRVNSSTVKLIGESFDAGQCRLDRWSATDAYDSEGNLYYRVTYKISVANEADFFERRFISRGVVDKNGKPAPIALGYLADTEYKLQADGTFFALADQVDPKKYYAQSFVTKKSSDWNRAVGLQDVPNPNITSLAGGNTTFGLQNPFSSVSP